jgi:hypothetical protein
MSGEEYEENDHRETERRSRPQILNNHNGTVELSRLEQEHYRKQRSQYGQQMVGKNGNRSTRKNQCMPGHGPELGKQS